MNKLNLVVIGFLIVGLSACVQDGSGKDGVDGMNGDAGPQGEPGRDGVNGTDGTDGEDGTDGADGADGAPGADGVDGEDGADGTDGTDGARGPAGADGTDGADGADGAPGADGVDGTNGTDGTDGADGADGEDGKDGTDGTTIVVVCGDGQCQAPAETLENCAADCTPPGSCVGNCGGSADSCYCDEACLTFGDCCDDYVDVCEQPPSPFCGDGFCNGSETFNTCPADCETPTFCGDDSCNNGETPSTCSEDCGTCGNGTCDAGETCANCDADCDPPAPPVNCDGDEVCDDNEDHYSCPTDCDEDPLTVYDECYGDECDCTLALHENYAFDAVCAYPVWHDGAFGTPMNVENDGVLRDKDAGRYLITFDADTASASTHTFTYRDTNTCAVNAAPQAWATYGTPSKFRRLTDEAREFIFCTYVADPNTSTPKCDLKVKLVKSTVGGKTTCTFEPAGNLHTVDPLLYN